MTRETLPVIFRLESDGDCTAVFPTLPGTDDPYTFTVYAHIGQHSHGSKEWYHSTRAAKPDQYADLLTELRRIYENDPDDPITLTVKARFTDAYDAARRASLAAIA